jgi:hypothetical protein
MEDIRTYRHEEDEQRRNTDEDRVEYSAASDDEVPFHIPRD